MKLFILTTFALICFLSFQTSLSSAAVIIPPSKNIIIPQGNVYQKIASLKLKDFQKLIGRKLTLKEKIGFLVLKSKIKHRGKAATTQGHTAMVFGILAIGLFVLGLFVPYVIIGSFVASIVAIISGSVALKRDKNDRKAFVGKLLGWITLGLIALILILAVIWLSSWGF
jgi:hypothetical protein